MPSHYFNYLQLCDVPAQVPEDMNDILLEARAARLYPGQGELDLLSLLRIMPAHLPLSIEVPTLAWANGVPAVERARQALSATQALLSRLEGPPAPGALA